MGVFLRQGHFSAVCEKSKAGTLAVFCLNIALLPGPWHAVLTKGLSKYVSIFFLTNQMFDTDLITMPPTEFVPDWLLPSQQFYVDGSERSDSTSHGHSD